MFCLGSGRWKSVKWMSVLFWFGLVGASWTCRSWTLLFASPWAGWQPRSSQLVVSKGASFPASYHKQITPLNLAAQALPIVKRELSFVCSSAACLWTRLPPAAVRSPLPGGHLGLSPHAYKQRGPDVVFQGAPEQPLPRDFCTHPEGASLLLLFRDLPWMWYLPCLCGRVRVASIGCFRLRTFSEIFSLPCVLVLGYENLV